MMQHKSYSADMLHKHLSTINYTDCDRAYQSLKKTDRTLALIIYLNSPNRLVTEALDTVMDSYYFQSKYVEVEKDSVADIRPMIIKAIVSCKKLTERKTR